jgi:hypothetical protein
MMQPLFQFPDDVDQAAQDEMPRAQEERDGTSVEEFIRQHHHLGSNANEDNDGLGVTRLIPGVVIGAVDAINGAEAKPCPEFVPTRHELLEVARHWATELLNIETVFFFDGQTGSEEWRTEAYAQRRLERIAMSVGDEEVEKVFSEVQDEFRKRVGDRYWEMFVNDNDEEWGKVCEGFNADVPGDANPPYGPMEPPDVF